MGEFGPLVTLARRARLGHWPFWSAQLLDVTVFDRLRRARLVDARRWSRRLLGSTLDTAIFFTIAFSAALSLA